jgi:DNA repair photolyase
VLVAPVLPGLSDRPEQLEAVVDAIVDAGATSISTVGLHLRPGVREHYLAWLEGVDPDLAARTADRYTRAYLPKAEQQTLTGLVRDMVGRAQRRGAGRYVGPRQLRYVEGDLAERVRQQMGGDRPAATPAPAQPGSEVAQLGLGL